MVGDGSGRLDDEEERVKALPPRVRVVAVVGCDVASAGGAVELVVAGAASLPEAEYALAQGLECVAKGDEPPVGSRRRAALGGAKPERRPVECVRMQPGPWPFLVGTFLVPN